MVANIALASAACSSADRTLSPLLSTIFIISAAVLAPLSPFAPVAFWYAEAISLMVTLRSRLVSIVSNMRAATAASSAGEILPSPFVSIASKRGSWSANAAGGNADDAHPGHAQHQPREPVRPQ